MAFVKKDFEESKNNPFLLATILAETKLFTWQNGGHSPYTLVLLEKDSSEYSKIQELFDASSYSRFHVTSIQRVENPFLMGHYLLKKEKLRNENGSVSERLLFHGTNSDNMDNICRNNFDWRRHGKARGHKFGQGVSFTPQSFYASHYTQSRLMFVSKVLVVRSIIGFCNTVVPPLDYDTTQNTAGTVIVKYEDTDFYPAYVIQYS